MAKVSSAIGAGDLGSQHIQSGVLGEFDATLFEDLAEGGPAATAVILVVRGEELLLANDAGVGATLVVLVIAASVGSLGSLLLSHVPLQRRQPALQLALVDVFTRHLGCYHRG